MISDPGRTRYDGSSRYEFSLRYTVILHFSGPSNLVVVCFHDHKTDVNLFATHLYQMSSQKPLFEIWFRLKHHKPLVLESPVLPSN